MNARELLDANAALLLYGREGEPLARRYHFAPQAFDALRAVLELHTDTRNGAQEPDDRCLECVEPFPCPTVQAIAEELGQP